MDAIRCKNCNKKLFEIDSDSLSSSLSRLDPQQEVLAVKCRGCKVTFRIKAGDLQKTRQMPVLRKVG